MKTFPDLLRFGGRFLVAAVLMTLMAGCASNKIDWNGRVGNYTYDQAVMELGPPDKHANLKDETLVAEWLTRRGYTTSYVSPAYYGHHRWYGPIYPTIVDSSYPDYFLRLIFGPDGKLREWKQFAR